MNTNDTISLDKKNTLYEIIHELDKHFQRSDLSSIKWAYVSFRMTYTFLPLIWERITEDIKLDSLNSGKDLPIRRKKDSAKLRWHLFFISCMDDHWIILSAKT